MKTIDTFHKHGGRIREVHAIAHRTYKGVAEWFFIATVEWNDGSVSEFAEVAPWALVSGELSGKDEVDALVAKLTDHLAEHGEWHEPRQKRDGRIYGWTPKHPDGRTSL